MFKFYSKTSKNLENCALKDKTIIIKMLRRIHDLSLELSLNSNYSLKIKFCRQLEFLGKFNDHLNSRDKSARKVYS